MQTMGGHRQRRTQRQQDVDQVYEAATLDLANELGWEHGVLYWWWSQLALAREACGEPRQVAEWMAMRNVREVFDKRGELGN